MRRAPNTSGLKQMAFLALLLAMVHDQANAAKEGSAGLTGDWNGARSRLADSGVAVTANYTSEMAGNTRGGKRQLLRYTDQWAFGATFDLEKMLGWNAAKFQVLITDRNGSNLSSDAGLGTLQQVQEVYGRGQTWRLTQFWYERAWHQELLEFRLGRVSPGQDFASFACDFQNLTFCGSQPGNVRGEYWFNWPVSQWGARIKVAPSENLYWKFGVYQVNPRYVDTEWARDNGLYPSNPSGTTGTLVPLELGWQPQWNRRPGSYKFGAWHDTSNAGDAYLDQNRRPLALTGGQPLQHDSRHGFYINFRQQISGAPHQRGATVFLNFTSSDRDTAVSMDRQLAVGIQYKDPFDKGGSDTAGAAFGINHVSTAVANRQYLQDVRAGEAPDRPDREYVVELFYGWKPQPYLMLRPNFQFIGHPGGIDTARNVVVIGLKTLIEF